MRPIFTTNSHVNLLRYHTIFLRDSHAV